MVGPSENVSLWHHARSLYSRILAVVVEVSRSTPRLDALTGHEKAVLRIALKQAGFHGKRPKTDRHCGALEAVQSLDGLLQEQPFREAHFGPIESPSADARRNRWSKFLGMVNSWIHKFVREHVSFVHRSNDMTLKEVVGLLCQTMWFLEALEEIPDVRNEMLRVGFKELSAAGMPDQPPAELPAATQTDAANAAQGTASDPPAIAVEVPLPPSTIASDGEKDPEASIAGPARLPATIGGDREEDRPAEKTLEHYLSELDATQVHQGPCGRRDALFCLLRRDGLTRAQIRDWWNSLTKEQRALASPLRSSPIGKGTAGYEIVKKATRKPL